MDLFLNIICIKRMRCLLLNKILCQLGFHKFPKELKYRDENNIKWDICKRNNCNIESSPEGERAWRLW